eukprot:8471205-Pyramimonas_sp.AAC.1
MLSNPERLLLPAVVQREAGALWPRLDEAVRRAASSVEVAQGKEGAVQVVSFRPHTALVPGTLNAIWRRSRDYERS